MTSQWALWRLKSPIYRLPAQAFVQAHISEYIRSPRYWLLWGEFTTLRWRHNGLDSVSNHQPPGCLLNRLIRRKSKKTSKLCVTGLCAGNSPGTGEFSAQMASYAENVSIWWRHHEWPVESPHQWPETRKVLPLITSSWNIIFLSGTTICKHDIRLYPIVSWSPLLIHA